MTRVPSERNWSRAVPLSGDSRLFGIGFIYRRRFLPRLRCGSAFLSRMTFREVCAGKRPIGQALPDDRIGNLPEPLGIRQPAFVEPERLLVEIPEQVEGLDRHVGPLIVRLSSDQKFSMPLVWTSPSA